MALPNRSCKVCREPAVHFCTTRHSVDATRTLEHFRCGSCGLVFVGNEIRMEELVELYAGQNSTVYYSQIAETLQEKMVSSAHDLKRWLKPDARILDVGTGSGQFLRCLLDEGFRHVAGHDLPGDTLADDLAGRCELFLDTDMSTVPAASFDAVTLLDVAEHVIDPMSLFRSCLRVLKPSGVLYIHTPVVTPIDRTVHELNRIPGLNRLARAWQSGRTTICHLQNYTRRSIRRALGDCGFEAPQIRVQNELSWPVRKYVSDYLCIPAGLPKWTVGPLTMLLYPWLATTALNPNKAIVHCRKPAAASPARTLTPVSRAA